MAEKASQDTYGQMTGAIGGVAVAFGILAGIRDVLGLSWIATVALVAGVLVLLGYAAWWVRSRVSQRWGRQQQTTAAQVPAVTVTAEEADVTVDEAGQPAPVHAGLTTVLARAGAIGREEVILDHEVTIEQIAVGTVYEFLLPQGRTSDDVGNHLGSIASMFGVTRLHLKLETSRHNDRRVRILKLNEPPFSKPFPAPTPEEIRAFPGVPIGHDVTGKLAGVPTFDRASMLIGGMTQMGKTTLVNGLIVCLLIAYKEFDLYLLDGKLCGLTKFEPLAVRYEASDDPEVLESLLDELNERVERRYGKMQEAIRNRKPAPVFKPVFFIIDEAADFYTDNGTKESQEIVSRNEDKSRSLVAKSLESGIATVMLTQRPANTAIPVKVRDQFLYRMCLYVASKGGAKVTLGDSYFETVAPIHPSLLDANIKGQGVLFANGVSTLLRGFNFPDKYIWEVVDQCREEREQAMPESPLKQAISLLRDKGVDFMLTADLAPALGIPDGDVIEAGKKLSERLGVPSGRKAKGRGYHLDDLVKAATAAGE
ncbi:FtsK/SpoIIIE domain-containing protein [Streptomyces sp. JV180]|uniref:FtsK/SpoIIIE domain-containing protein n=1 Tax=Streptomyces sp. JV180 TaxID=858634 RepID=UPI00168AEE86|nr:FtsK/SpoIIIE domain-containing protein [Streptomyces sp. JV180]MBD3549997.1 hypothetical protein [Streptomyces sp. JV180]